MSKQELPDNYYENGTGTSGSGRERREERRSHVLRNLGLGAAALVALAALGGPIVSHFYNDVTSTFTPV